MDGQVLDARYQPCYPQAESSACCMLNGTQGEDQQNDLCLDSGLCQSTSGWFAGFLYINGCTDQTGKADGCAKLCSFMGNQYSWSVLQCEPGKFCCRAGSDTENCCGDNSSMISTSHIGNLLLPGSTAAINTTFNFTTDAPAAASGSSSNSTCSSSANTVFDKSLCPADNSATVGGAVGGILGAGLIGALVALAFALRSRKHFRSDLANTKASLTTTETLAAEEKANFQKQREDQQRHMQLIPPTYNTPMTHGYPTMTGTYPQQQSTPPTELPHSHSYGYSELGGEGHNSRVELTTEVPKTG
ncbi:hypothetical protein PMZ80_000423 [Knufia obscura]|uniref:Uncharacterized protein n=1 Tax=Knufia obscura TaxID=1635080 RepID=A0ABR0S0D7_9EURO|nr:hypothetical protein PMZ80_000423 [Knufia obscura]